MQYTTLGRAGLQGFAAVPGDHEFRAGDERG